MSPVKHAGFKVVETIGVFGRQAQHATQFGDGYFPARFALLGVFLHQPVNPVLGRAAQLRQLRQLRQLGLGKVVAQIEQIFPDPVAEPGFDHGLVPDVVALVHQGPVHAVGLLDPLAIRPEYFNVENPGRQLSDHFVNLCIQRTAVAVGG